MIAVRVAAAQAAAILPVLAICRTRELAQRSRRTLLSLLAGTNSHAVTPLPAIASDFGADTSWVFEIGGCLAGGVFWTHLRF